MVTRDRRKRIVMCEVESLVICGIIGVLDKNISLQTANQWENGYWATDGTGSDLKIPSYFRS